MSEPHSLKSILTPAPRKSWSEPPENIHEEECQSVGYGRVGTKPQIMLVFGKCDGYVLALPYASLRSITSHDWERTMAMDFVERRVTVEGVNLEKLFRYLCQNRVVELRELDRDKAMSQPADEPVIHRVHIRNLRTRTDDGKGSGEGS